MTIPRIIHQVWFKIGSGPNSPPKEYNQLRQSWREKHPDWTFMDWDLTKARELLQTHYPKYLTMFDSYKKTIFKIDSIRYFILHHYGGFYIDQDTTAHHPLDGLLSHKVILCLNPYTKKLIHNNHFMGSEPHAPFFAECIRRLPAASIFQTSKDSYVGTFSTAGPFFLTGVAMSYRKKKELYILAYDREQLYFTHHEKHSWKVTKSILGDIGRLALVTGGVVAGGLVIKHLIQTR